MKQKKKQDLEFIDLDENESAYENESDYENQSDYEDEYEDEYEDDYEDAYEAEYESLAGWKEFISAKVLIIIITIVIIMAAFLLLMLKRNHTEDAEGIVPAMEEMTGEGLQTEQMQDEQVQDQAGQSLPDAAGEKQSNTEGAENTDQEADVPVQGAEDPQTETMSTQQGTAVDVTELLSSGAVAETEEITLGIDVARYQGTIDWAQVAASGIEFTMVRVGYRTDSTREICADTNARYNMQEAQKHGIKVGAYFFSTATSEEEAVEEADWVADYISQYQITYPVAYDCEGFDRPESAQYALTKTERTDIAIAFLEQIYSRGYTPMFYSSMGELTGEAKWETSRIENTYKVWVSQYPTEPYPQTKKSSYAGSHAMWQYTNRGTVAGIDRPVDVNIAYFGYEGTAEAINEEAPEEAQADVEALMNFTEVSEEVTAKDSTNLRNIPSQGSDSTVVYTLPNGETLMRTGISDSGWSRLTYNGQIVYAVSSYLTTDLSYQTPQAQPQEGAGSGDGLKTRFEERNEQVTAKIEVNLRTLPSVTNPDAVVTAVLHNGEYVTRTGINEAYGWSRVDYNGQTLYCISSYLIR